MRVTVKHSALNSLVLGMALLWIFGGCAHLEKYVGQKPTGFVHTVQWPGENLSLIAKWYTGSSSNWKTLANANPKLNPNSIRIGEKIFIPKSLAKTEEPMPRNFLSSSPSDKSRVKSPSSEQSAPEEPLYAPI